MVVLINYVGSLLSELRCLEINLLPDVVVLDDVLGTLLERLLSGWVARWA